MKPPVQAIKLRLLCVGLVLRDGGARSDVAIFRNGRMTFDLGGGGLVFCCRWRRLVLRLRLVL